MDAAREDAASPAHWAGLAYRTNDARCAEAPRATGYLVFELLKMLQPDEATGAAAFFGAAFFDFLAFFAFGAAFFTAFLAAFLGAAFLAFFA